MDPKPPKHLPVLFITHSRCNRDETSQQVIAMEPTHVPEPLTGFKQSPGLCLVGPWVWLGEFGGEQFLQCEVHRGYTGRYHVIPGASRLQVKRLQDET